MELLITDHARERAIQHGCELDLDAILECRIVPNRLLDTNRVFNRVSHLDSGTIHYARYQKYLLPLKETKANLILLTVLPMSKRERQRIQSLNTKQVREIMA